MIEVRYERGVYLPNENIWLDPWDAKPFAFVSHAHSDHIAPHEEIIVSERTSRLMQARLPGERHEHVLNFGEKATIRGMEVTLIPAGHIFGSAQFFLETGSGSLLYTGDFKLRAGRSAEPAEWRSADTLIMETTFGLPRYRFPPTEEVVAQIVAFCRDALENRSRMLEKIREKRVAMISGWAVDPSAVYRYQVDAAFPLSDHADYTDLVRYVDLVKPQRVLTLHGFAAEFARDLRDRGIEAWALSEENQMELTLGKTVVAGLSSAPQTHAAGTAAATGSEFHAFAAIGEAIAATPAKLEKVRRLAEYLRTLDSTQLPIAAIYFTGKAFPQSDLRTIQAGWAVIHRALVAATKMSEAEFRRIASSHGDAGKTALEALEGRTAPAPFALADSRAFFDSLHKARGPLAKTELLQTRLAKLSAREGQYVIKILTGDLRIGLREGLV
ncbi:MAG: hypothetical protein LC642_05745, partial [Verrucomicrobiaceae bacterium]|nr:hypothetical protein [Verrucomicrobiaceae bacterium]